ncbi:MAG: hypothetical protein K5912_04505 [Alphaproteobacteria bacterium]|nr:hypothetical protein [Alphaproteobacteria bacterium]
MGKFHSNLNRMALFIALVLCGIILFYRSFFEIATANIYLNGVIIGTTLYGVILCFIKVFKLLPEYKWLRSYFDDKRSKIVPKLLRPVALALNNKQAQVTTTQVTDLMDLVSSKIEDDRESVRYITNTLIFLGLLGTFWGLILTVGGFADLIGSLNFNDDTVLESMKTGLSRPLGGMATAFTSSLLGLAGSLVVGFLSLQLQMAQNAVFQTLGDFMARNAAHHENKCCPEPVCCAQISKILPVVKTPEPEVDDTQDSDTDELVTIQNALTRAGYNVRTTIEIYDNYHALVAIGNDERVFIIMSGVDSTTLLTLEEYIETAFVSSMKGEPVDIDLSILCVNGSKRKLGDSIECFKKVSDLEKYLTENPNRQLKDMEEAILFDAFAGYIDSLMEYLFKQSKK